MSGVALRTLRVSRMERSLHRFGDQLTARAFTEAERAYCGPKRRAPQHYAVRFAAKLAARQLLRQGRLTEIEVARDEWGAPALKLHGGAASAGEGRCFWVSLSHDEDLAVALVVSGAEGEEPSVD